MLAGYNLVMNAVECCHRLLIHISGRQRDNHDPAFCSRAPATRSLGRARIAGFRAPYPLHRRTIV